MTREEDQSSLYRHSLSKKEAVEGSEIKDARKRGCPCPKAILAKP